MAADDTGHLTRRGGPTGFAQVPRALLRDPDIPALAKTIWAQLDDMTSRGSQVPWPSQETLAEWNSVTDRTVRTALTVLQNTGWLEIQHRPGRTNLHILVWKPAEPVDNPDTPETSFRTPRKPASGVPRKPASDEAQPCEAQPCEAAPPSPPARPKRAATKPEGGGQAGGGGFEAAKREAITRGWTPHQVNDLLAQLRRDPNIRSPEAVAAHRLRTDPPPGPDQADSDGAKPIGGIETTYKRWHPESCPHGCSAEGWVNVTGGGVARCPGGPP